jgi:DNA polymerase-1
VIVVGFDIEGASAETLYSHPRDGSYLRLMGKIVDGQIRITSDRHEFVEWLNCADWIYGHNVFRFDLPALAVHAGADYTKLAGKAIDTITLARLADPPGARGQKPWGQRGYYGLDALARRLGHAGKTDDLKGLAKEFGGFDKIPVDDPRYVEYLSGDLYATHAALAGLWDSLDGYARREMRIAAIQGQMSLSGWRIDEKLLGIRLDNEESLKANALRILHSDYGVPLAGKAPLSSSAGKEALIKAFADLGLPSYPYTATGKLATSRGAMGDGFYFIGAGASREKLDGILRHYGDNPRVVRLCKLIAAVTGASAKYAEIDKYLTRGRVHGGIGEDQASGRWAMTKPSLTNVGKRGDKVKVRDVFLPDEGHVLLSADLDQVDMRALAGLSQDPAYMALFGPGMDAHAEIAELVLGDRKRREAAKPIGHGWNYGRSNTAIADSTGIDLAVVERFDAAMRHRFPRLCRWRDEVRERAGYGELLDNGFGRKMRCDPCRAYTQGPALMGQGAARDLMCHGLLRLHPSVHPMLRAVVHDEIVLSVPADIADDVAAHVKAALTFTWRGVPITAGVSRPSKSWAACYRKEE